MAKCGLILERLIVSRNVRKADPPVSPAEQSKGKHIREQRETLGLSMKELAYDAGISSSFLSAIETGKKNPSAGAWRSLQESLQRRSGRNESIGERLIAFRRRANLTQEQISKSAGISRSTLAAIERGRQPSKMTEIALEQTIRDLALKYKIFFNR